MGQGALGRDYADGELLIRQGDVGNHMYVIQEGRVEVSVEKDGREIKLATLQKGDIVGEMAIFESERRSASVRAQGSVRALTVDKKNFLSRISEDPSLAFRLVGLLCGRIRDLNEELARLQSS